MKFEIKNWYSGTIIFTIETESWKLAVEAAIKAKTNLRSANLRYANLRYANLSYANLSSANLRYANLRYANLRYANLSYADLSYADLSYADLRYTNLRYANLSYADLSYAKNTLDFISISRIGSRNDCLSAIKWTENKIEILTGCYRGKLAEFEEKVKEVHGDNEHGKAYIKAIDLIKIRFGIAK